MDARYFASNRPYSLLFVSQKYGRQISGSESGLFYCRREARDLDARFVAKNRPFFVVF